MSNLTIFNFESKEVRFVGTADKPEWIAVDVCAVLDIRNNRDALSRLDEDEKGVAIIDTPGGKQELATVNESGLYSLTLTSRKPQAKRFKKWITRDVIPTIRRTGKYELPQVEVEAPQLPIPSLEEISTLLDLTLGKAGLDQKIVAGALR
ncbi:prophage antirepressor (plasmid) [Calothrix sp. NIES-4071]|nr:prophage antirepressor [Calothrix sp. NIES-4071]BAZ65181.1 prophage antirepressor [Calothrix sp. NIES-4105]